MKKLIIIIFLCVVLISCQTLNQQPKEYFQDRSRAYQTTYDSVLEKLVEFTAYSKIPSKITAITNNLIEIEETFNEEQLNKYTDYSPQSTNVNINDCQEKLMINIKSEPSKIILDIKSIINCNISYKRFIGKGSVIFNENIACKSNGVREKEILDFLSNNNIMSHLK